MNPFFGLLGNTSELPSSSSCPETLADRLSKIERDFSVFMHEMTGEVEQLKRDMKHVHHHLKRPVLSMGIPRTVGDIETAAEAIHAADQAAMPETVQKLDRKSDFLLGRIAEIERKLNKALGLDPETEVKKLLDEE